MSLKFKRSLTKLLCFIFLSVMVLSNLPTTITKAATQYTVVVNPGHSIGYDSGAVSQYKDEATVNQELAGKVVRLLEQRGYKVYITHTTDTALSSKKLLNQADGSGLVNVGKAINSVNPDLAIAIHHNSGGATASGTELYWSSYRSFDTDGVYTVDGLWSDGGKTYRDITPCKAAQESLRFATIIQNNWAGHPRLSFRKTVERNDYVPAHTYCPSVLYEGGFLSNPSEAEYLASDSYQNDAATRIVNSIDQFFGNGSITSGSYNPGSYSPSDSSTNIAIMGNVGTTATQLVTFYNKNSHVSFPSYYQQRGVSLQQFAQMYVEEAQTEGVRADIAFAQTMLETGYLGFGGSVSISQFNFAGIGATGGSVAGADFSQYGDNATGIRMGIRAQIQHLKAYASTAKLVNTCVDPRFNLVTRGSATTIGGLSGKWAADTSYATKIVAILSKITAVSGSSNGTTTTPSTPDNNNSSSSNPSTSPSAPSGSVSIYRLYNNKTAEHLFTSDLNEANVLRATKDWDYEGIAWYSPTSGTAVYRLYSPITKNHLYTTDENEVRTLTANPSNWTLDNNGNALFYSGGSLPIYRTYHEGIRQHLLTSDTNEYQILGNNGWNAEGVKLYAVSK